MPVVLRSEKGSELTHSEMDGNFTAVRNAESNITDLQNDVVALESSVTTLQEDVFTLQTNVTDLQSATSRIVIPGAVFVPEPGVSPFGEPFSARVAAGLRFPNSSSIDRSFASLIAPLTFASANVNVIFAVSVEGTSAGSNIVLVAKINAGSQLEQPIASIASEETGVTLHSAFSNVLLDSSATIGITAGRNSGSVLDTFASGVNLEYVIVELV